MERLTKRDSFDGTIKLTRETWEPIAPYDEVIEALSKLADYEDTGLEPEEIHKSDEMLRAFIEHNRTTEYPRTLDWLLHITKSEAEGRLLVLPCRVWDTVYIPNNWLNIVVQFEIVEIQLFVDETVIIDDSDNEYHVSDFGKTVFLTREEAEKALEGMNNG